MWTCPARLLLVLAALGLAPGTAEAGEKRAALGVGLTLTGRFAATAPSPRRQSRLTRAAAGRTKAEMAADPAPVGTIELIYR